MNYQEVLDSVEEAAKVYSKKQVFLGAFFGGPLVGGYLLAKNYEVLEQRQYVPLVWVGAISGLLLLFAVVIFTLEDLYIYKIIYGFGTLGVVRKVYIESQERKIKDYLRRGGKMHNNLRVVRSTVLSLLLVAGFVQGAVYKWTTVEEEKGPAQAVQENRRQEERAQAVQENRRQEEPVAILSIKYGAQDNTISYNRNQITTLEISPIGAGLQAIGFFNNQLQRIVFVELIDRNYIFSIQDPSARPTSRFTIRRYKKLSRWLEGHLPQNSTFQILLVDDNFETVIGEF